MKALALAALMASPAASLDLCADRDVVVAGAARSYGEVSRVGLAGPDGMLEVLASTEGPEAGRTWTLIITDGTGTACILATGVGVAIIPTGEEM